MIENPDQQLSELGAVPDDLQAIVTRTLGDRPITAALADELLEALSAGRQFDLSASTPAALPALQPPSIADAAAVLTSISAPPPALDSVVPPLPGAFDSFAPPPPAALDTIPPPAAAALDTIPPPSAAPSELPPSRPAPMPWDSLPAPPPPAAAAAPMPWDSQPAPQLVAAEVTAQAIVAAFDDPEPESAEHDTLESSPAPELHMEPAPNLELSPRAARRGDWSGSRRPDLDELLDQPLDALDFERSEQTDVDSRLPQAEEAADAASATTPPSGGDDFEILVDDEILEIAEDDVELVDDDNS